MHELDTCLHETISESNLLRKDLEKAQADIFNTHHELRAIQEQVAQNAILKTEVCQPIYLLQFYVWHHSCN